MKIQINRIRSNSTVFFLLLISTTCCLQIIAQTRKVVFKDFIFRPFATQTSTDNPLELPYFSRDNQIKISVEETDEFDNTGDFFRENTEFFKKGSSMKNGISSAYIEKQNDEDENSYQLIGFIKNIKNEAKIIVSMEYPKNNVAASKKAIAMFNTFQSNSIPGNSPPTPRNPAPPVPVPPNPPTPPDPTNPNNPPPQFKPQDILDAHNVFRKELELPSLTWSNELAKYAQEWANELAKNRNCRLQHRPHDQNSRWNLIYGENIFSGSSGYTAVDAVNSWGEEKSNYNINTKECFKSECGHYTQIIWKKTTKVGCAVSKCANGNIIVVCNYDPAGNMMGEKPF